MFNGKKLNTEEPLKSTHQLFLQISYQEIRKTKCDICAFYVTVPYLWNNSFIQLTTHTSHPYYH